MAPAPRGRCGGWAARPSSGAAEAQAGLPLWFSRCEGCLHRAGVPRTPGDGGAQQAAVSWAPDEDECTLRGRKQTQVGGLAWGAWVAHHPPPPTTPPLCGASLPLEPAQHHPCRGWASTSSSRGSLSCPRDRRQPGPSLGYWLEPMRQGPRAAGFLPSSAACLFYSGTPPSAPPQHHGTLPPFPTTPPAPHRLCSLVLGPAWP